MRQIVLDTETTGLDPALGHRVIEIGCLEMVNRQLTGNNLQFYLNPEREIEREAIQVHGITNEFLVDKPKFREVAQELFDYLNGAELVIHNAPFDIGFLNHEFKAVLSDFVSLNEICSVTDTLLLARRKHPGQHNSLDALCRRYNVDRTGREFHGALLDARLLAQVYLLMTGGQGELFSEISNTVAPEIITKQNTKKTVVNLELLTIPATADELLAHNNFLDQMRKKNNCRWDEVETQEKST